MTDKTTASGWRENGEPDPHGTRYECQRESLAMGGLTDDQLANGAFLNYDRPLDIHAIMTKQEGYASPIAWMTAVKDRIRWLSRQLFASQQRNNEQAVEYNAMVDTLLRKEGELREALSELYGFIKHHDLMDKNSQGMLKAKAALNDKA